MKKLIIFSILIFLASCGITQRQEVGGTADVNLAITINFPICAKIEDEDKILECVREATTIIISIGGIDSLTAEQIEILEKLGIKEELLNDESEINPSD